jgi:hypothetical protein
MPELSTPSGLTGSPATCSSVILEAPDVTVPRVLEFFDAETATVDEAA